MNKIILSIIIPTHDSQNTIRSLLMSIINSPSVDFRKLEVIVFDDGSKDNTIKIVNEIKKNIDFKFLILNSKLNLGPAKARNLGAKRARGKYLLFLDGDVELKKQSLVNVFKLISSNKIKAFTGIWDYHQKTNKFFPQFKALRDWSYWFSEREVNSHYYLFSTRIAGIEKNLFKKLHGFIEDYNEPTVEDIEFTYRIERISSIKFCSNIIVNHEFEVFFPIAIKYFKRSRDWIKLYLKRFRFDPVATSKTEAIKSIVSSLILLFLFISIIFRWFFALCFVLFVAFSYLERKFWRLLLIKKGFLFLLKSIPTSIILYQFINAGAVWGYLTSSQKAR